LAAHSVPYTAIQKFRDGPNLDSAGLPPALTVAAKIFPDPSPQAGHEMWRDATRDSHLATAPTVGFLSIKDRYSKEDNLVAGRVWQRLHLMATEKKISVHPMNQPIEWVDRQRQLGMTETAKLRLEELIGTANWNPTFSFRIGFSTQKAHPSPRRPATDCLA